MMSDSALSGWRRQAFDEVYKNHHGLGSYKVLHYFFIYDQILARFLEAQKPVTLLEIGVQSGGSLQIWKKYLPPGSEVHGMDINPKCAELEFGEGIHFHLGSASNVNFVNKLFARQGFDVILDDGSHFCPEVTATFLNLFKKLNPGGVYIVEDLHTSYWPDAPYLGGLRRPGSSIEFFKEFVDTLHVHQFDPRDPRPVNLTPFLSLYREEIANISFYQDICAITRFGLPKKEPLTATLTGEIFKVVTFTDPDKMRLENLADAVNTARIMYQPHAVDNAPRPLPTDAAVLERLFNQGVEAFEGQCFEQAIAIFSDLYYRSPERPVPLVWLAFICARQGRAEEARLFIDQFSRAVPHHNRAETCAALGGHFLAGGNPAMAVAYLQDALAAAQAQSPGNRLWAVYPVLARSLHQSGQSAAALALLDQILGEAPVEIQQALRDEIRVVKNVGGGGVYQLSPARASVFCMRRKAEGRVARHSPVHRRRLNTTITTLPSNPDCPISSYIMVSVFCCAMPPVPAPIRGKAMERYCFSVARRSAARTDRRTDFSVANQSRLIPATWMMPRNGSLPAVVCTALPSGSGP
jgi:tetratricopeptide (TPR) repeat protein/cephalosporin hydroxylase